MSVKALSEIAENYFSSLNPIAERISEDIESIREAYEDLWRCLSQRERDQIINETVIYPEAILKYALNPNADAGYDLAHLHILCEPGKVTGSKYIVDESTGLSWRDEHSGPFSWKTPSQIDLSIFGTSNPQSEASGTESTTNPKLPKNHKEFISPRKVYANGTGHEGKEGKHQNGYNKKSVETPDSPNVVIGGTCSKISGLCSKLKFLPGKSFSYEVKTVVSTGATVGDANILEKLRASAVNKIQSTIKLVGGKGEKRGGEADESENLVNSRDSTAIVRLQKPSPRVSKPKSPPPPPPPPSSAAAAAAAAAKKSSPTFENDSENAGLLLLQDSSEQSLPSVGRESRGSKVTQSLSDDVNSISTECTPLSGPSFDNIPKSGFDFLDNW